MSVHPPLPFPPYLPSPSPPIFPSLFLDPSLPSSFPLSFLPAIPSQSLGSLKPSYQQCTLLTCGLATFCRERAHSTFRQPDFPAETPTILSPIPSLWREPHSPLPWGSPLPGTSPCPFPPQSSFSGDEVHLSLSSHPVQDALTDLPLWGVGSTHWHC